MGNEPKHIKPFTEAESPIPLLPTDEAWQNMQQKLDEQLPEKRRGGAFSAGKRLIIAAGILAGLAVYYFLYQAADTTVLSGGKPVRQDDSKKQDQHKKSNTSTLSVTDTVENHSSAKDEDKVISHQQQPFNTADEVTLRTTPRDQLTPITEKSSDPKQQANQLQGVDRHKTLPGKTGVGKNDQQTRDAPSISGSDMQLSGGKNKSASGQPSGSKTPKDDLVTGKKTISQKNIVTGKTDNPAITGNKVTGIAKDNTNISAGNITTDEVEKHPAIIHSPVQQPDLTSDPRILPGTAALTAARNAIMDSAGGKQSSKDKRALTFRAGLQWQLPAPLNNSDRYFTGPDGSSQPYRLLIPAAWLTIQKNRHQVTLDVSAFQSIILSENIYEARNDTMNRYTKSILKTFGYGGGLHYNYSFFRHWRAGAGLQGLLLQKALGRNIIDSFGAHIDDTFTLSRSHSDWKKMSPFRLNAGAELWFQQPRWEAGLRIGMPVTRPFKDAGINTRNTIQAALLLRWRIF